MSCVIASIDCVSSGGSAAGAGSVAAAGVAVAGADGIGVTGSLLASRADAGVAAGCAAAVWAVASFDPALKPCITGA